MSDTQIYVIQHYEPRDFPDWMYTEFSSEELERHKKSEYTGFHKIGIAQDPKRRLSSLRGGTPHSLRIVTTIEAKKDPRQVERELHEFYGGTARRGEWFMLPISHIQDLKRLEVLRPGVIDQLHELSVEVGDLSIAQPREIDLYREVERVRAELRGST